ncbi:MAG: tetratricopeptide repeat protein [Syntrophotaleaceae bacterium]
MPDRIRYPGLKGKMAISTGFTILAVALSMAFGCAPGGKLPPVAEAPEVPPPSAQIPVSEETGVQRLADGREGFSIVQPSTLDGAALADFERAVVLMNQADYSGAIALLEKVVEKFPENTAARINLGMACARNGQAEQAETHLQKALTLFPGHPVACNEYGLLLRKAGRFAEARTIYEQALAKFPEYLPVHKNLGILCDIYLNDPACAVGHYEIYSEATPQDDQIRIWIADLRMRLGNR